MHTHSSLCTAARCTSTFPLLLKPNQVGVIERTAQMTQSLDDNDKLSANIHSKTIQEAHKDDPEAKGSDAKVNIERISLLATIDKKREKIQERLKELDEISQKATTKAETMKRAGGEIAETADNVISDIGTLHNSATEYLKHTFSAKVNAIREAVMKELQCAQMAQHRIELASTWSRRRTPLTTSRPRFRSASPCTSSA